MIVAKTPHTKPRKSISSGYIIPKIIFNKKKCSKLLKTQDFAQTSGFRSKPQDFAQNPLRQPKSTPRPGNRSSSQESQDPGTWIQVSEPRSQDPGIRTLWRTSKPYQDAKIRISAPLRPLYATNFEKNARPCTRPNVFFLTPRIRGTEIFRRDSAKTPCFSTLPAKKRVFRTSEFLQKKYDFFARCNFSDPRGKKIHFFFARMEWSFFPHLKTTA